MITIKSFEFNYFQENTFLLYDDTREAVLIDCGCCRKEEEKELTDFILENKLTLKHLLCTHLHVDHVFGNGFIYDACGFVPGVGRFGDRLRRHRRQIVERGAIGHRFTHLDAFARVNLPYLGDAAAAAPPFERALFSEADRAPFRQADMSQFSGIVIGARIQFAI